MRAESKDSWGSSKERLTLHEEREREREREIYIYIDRYVGR